MRAPAICDQSALLTDACARAMPAQKRKASLSSLLRGSAAPWPSFLRPWHLGLPASRIGRISAEGIPPQILGESGEITPTSVPANPSTLKPISISRASFTFPYQRPCWNSDGKNCSQALAGRQFFNHTHQKHAFAIRRSSMAWLISRRCLRIT